MSSAWEKIINMPEPSADQKAVLESLFNTIVPKAGQVDIGLMGDDVGLDFGTPVTVIGFSPQEAADFASELLKAARRAAQQQGIMIEFKI